MSSSTQRIPPLHDVDIRLLRIFKSVVECKGFSAAEETLGVGRSTISKHVADLEERLLIRLCERGRSGFNVTPHGQIVYEATIELLDSLDHFRSRVALAKGRLSGSINLWVMDNTQLEHGNPLAVALEVFKRRPGSATININTAGPEAVEDAVLNRLANVGVTIANSDLPGLTYRAVGVETNALYCSTSNEIARALDGKRIDDALLTKCDFVTRGYLRSVPTIRGRHWKSTAVAYHVEATLQLILSGQYLGILPDHIARPWVDNGRIIKLPMPEAEDSTTISLVFRTKSKSLPLVTAMGEDIAEAYRHTRKQP
ncbi:DNA-binding transcriptional LysR family regulator [Pararhizobium capsulatum DSM 1112]|uniref:DNA-binding transcriptional LysR family regulator n=1 Tax=Pararhizobium capsulatum DSM 1112 TaxID=1121113 RepID=A0ABU0C478_9HYPH|nr:LysR family transcriptional regulator [Pararhizobium capsulatum]MDQ0323887.1 DNA-binding transcriptional LysR family regulator [Pararhizobium capsulatum DSM 1112]